MNVETRRFVWGIIIATLSAIALGICLFEIAGGAKWYYWVSLVINIGGVIYGYNYIYKSLK